jgi:L-ascorbate metabolism protein UlaG (beta-lactamase superfamily)
MRITKFGHSCLLVEEKSARIMIDPGNFSSGQESAEHINAILITHEHPDHVSVESLKAILDKNPQASVYTNESVAANLLCELPSLQPFVIHDGTEFSVKGVAVKVFGVDHACIHDSIPLIRNSGFLIGGCFFYPGDALTQFPENVEVLALPVAAPWMRLSEAIDYAVKLKPKVCFPVHDGQLRKDRLGSTRFVSKSVFEKAGIGFVDMVEGSIAEF